MNTSLLAADVSDIEVKLFAATDKLNAAMGKNAPAEGKELKITVAPLLDPNVARLRKFGTRGADIISRRLHERHPPWLRVLDRLALPKLVQQDRSWIIQTVRQSHMGNEAAGGLFEQVNLLVIGTMMPVGNAVEVELRLVNPVTTTIVATASCRVALTPDEKTELLKFVEAGSSGVGGPDLARVSKVDLKLTAQRPESHGPHREWQVEPGDTLRAGDQFNIRFLPDADANVYIFLYGSDKKAALLFPTDDWEEQYRQLHGRAAKPQDNYCRAEMDYHAPGLDADDRQRFYVLDNTPGANYLYICAHREPVRNIDDIRRRLPRFRTEQERSDFLTRYFDYVETFNFKQR